MKELRPFRAWCQKVLPLVYDDSLSYYELLCKVVKHLNDEVEAITELQVEFEKLYNFVNEYLDSVNFKSLVDAKIDQMVEEGYFDKLIKPLVDAKLADITNSINTTNSNVTDLQSTVAAIITRFNDLEEIARLGETYIPTYKVEKCGVSSSITKCFDMDENGNSYFIYSDNTNFWLCDEAGNVILTGLNADYGHLNSLAVHATTTIDYFYIAEQGGSDGKDYVTVVVRNKSLGTVTVTNLSCATYAVSYYDGKLYYLGSGKMWVANVTDGVPSLPGRSIMNSFLALGIGQSFAVGKLTDSDYVFAAIIYSQNCNVVLYRIDTTYWGTELYKILKLPYTCDNGYTLYELEDIHIMNKALYIMSFGALASYSDQYEDIVISVNPLEDYQYQQFNYSNRYSTAAYVGVSDFNNLSVLPNIPKYLTVPLLNAEDNEDHRFYTITQGIAHVLNVPTAQNRRVRVDMTGYVMPFEVVRCRGGNFELYTRSGKSYVGGFIMAYVNHCYITNVGVLGKNTPIQLEECEVFFRDAVVATDDGTCDTMFSLNRCSVQLDGYASTVKPPSGYTVVPVTNFSNSMWYTVVSRVFGNTYGTFRAGGSVMKIPYSSLN